MTKQHTSWLVSLLALCVAGQGCTEARKLDALALDPKLESKQQAITEAQVPPEQRAQLFAPAGLTAVRELVRVGPDSVTFDYIVVADSKNHTVRRVETSTGLVTTLAGTPGVPGPAIHQLRNPTAVVAGGGPADVIIADTGNHVLKRVYQTWNDETGAPMTAVEIVAGTTSARGYQSAQGAALFDEPQGLAVGNIASTPFFKWFVQTVYVADTGNGVIRRVNVPSKTVELIAGTPGVHGYADASSGAQAMFNRPTGLYVANNKLYVADTGNHAIRVIDLAQGGTFAVTTLTGKPAEYGHRDGKLSEAQFAQPVGIALGPSHRTLRVTDRASYTVREIDVAADITQPRVRTLAGKAWERGSLDGNSVTSRFRAPTGVSTNGVTTYIADTGNNLIRTLRDDGPEGTSVATLTGTRAPGTSDGWPEAFSLGRPTALACDGNRFFVNGNGVQEVRLDAAGSASGVARTVASSDWPHLVYGHNALFRMLFYQTERLDLATGVRSIFTGVDDDDNDAHEAILATPDAFYTRFSFNDVVIRKFSYTGDAWAYEELSRIPWSFTDASFMQKGLTAWEDGYVYSQSQLGVRKANLSVRPVSFVDVPVAWGAEETLAGLAVHGNYAYFTSDGEGAAAHRHTVRRLDLTTGAVTVFAGTPGVVDAPFERPSGLCISGDYLIVADTENDRVQRVHLSTSAVEPLALGRGQ